MTVQALFTDIINDFTLVIYYISHIGIAFLLALPIAWDRERSSRSAGLRTFPLVSVASCSFTLVAISLAEEQGKMLAGIITGIGFIGGGAIVKNSGTANGTATAAGIWVTGAVGMAVAMKFFAMAFSLCILTLTAYILLNKFKHK